MPKTRLFAALLAGLLLTCSLFLGCAKDAAPQLTVAADRYERTLYEDDTAIALTVAAPAGCTEIAVSQLGASYETIALWSEEGAETFEKNQAADPLHYTEPYRTVRFSRADAAITEAADGESWALTVDFGLDGVYGLSVAATLANGKVTEVKAPVFVRYPEVNIVDGGVARAWETYILRNSNEPFYFIVDLAKTSVPYRDMAREMWGAYAFYNGANATECSYLPEAAAYYESVFGKPIENPWTIKFRDGSPVYGEYVLWDYLASDLRIWSRAFPGDATSRFSIDDMTYPTGSVILCMIAETPEEPIHPTTRAAISYLAGAEIDAALYPDAASCLAGGTRALAEALTPGMTEFEKAKALHDWMLEEGKRAERGAAFDALTAFEQDLCLSTALGFMQGYGGECMGWSDAYHMLLTMAGICGSTVSCAAAPGGATDAEFFADHQFNIARLDGEVYYFDVYWDGAGGGYEAPPYTYFCMTSEEAAKSHTWRSEAFAGPPAATSTKYQVDPATGALLG